MTTATDTKTPVTEIVVGDKIHDPAKTGTHGQWVEVEWVGHHRSRKRTYFAGVEELTRNPVTVAYDDTETVKKVSRL